MGLWQTLWRFLTGAPSPRPEKNSDRTPAPPPPRKARRRARLNPLRSARTRETRHLAAQETVDSKPYRFARPCVTGGWLDLSLDGDSSYLERTGLPRFKTPQELADWLQISLGKLAWLIHRFEEEQIPAEERRAHYHFRWLRKRSGGRRLIESPKPTLKRAQLQILRQILDKIPPHSAAHGFIAGRSIRTNADPHAGQRVIVKFDLENFYATVGLSRVTAIFRSLGYSREAAIWLARLTTSSLPASAMRSKGDWQDAQAYRQRHLPQGAPTSPALANLSAFSLDLRLSGLARSFGANYTRYGDDLTFSGDKRFLRSLAAFIPLVQQIIREERFRVNKAKRRVIRDHCRQQVTGVVVNRHPNVSRREYDRLKATLTNCIRRGPSTQNHERVPDFAASLRGSIAHVSHLNAARGSRLQALFEQIDWNR